LNIAYVKEKKMRFIQNLRFCAQNRSGTSSSAAVCSLQMDKNLIFTPPHGLA
jgi:hypothetical protein